MHIFIWSNGDVTLILVHVYFFYMYDEDIKESDEGAKCCFLVTISFLKDSYV